MSSKYLKDFEARKTKIIHVYRNGDQYARATFIVLRLLEQQDMERIIRAIEEKVRLPLNRPIRKLFEMTGVLVTSCIQFEDGKYYVAASAENFMPMEYGQVIGWVRVGPVKTSKYANVHFISKSEEEGTSKSLNSSNNMLTSTGESGKKATRAKSPAKRTPTNIKKNASKKAETKTNMIASEHAESPSGCDGVNMQEVGIDNKEENRDICENVPSEDSRSDEDHSQNRFEDLRITDHKDQYREENIIDSVVTNTEDSDVRNDEHMTQENNHNIKEGRDEFEEETSHDGRERIDENQAEAVYDADVKRGEVNEEGNDINMNEGGNKILDDAATKIQASYRGHRVRGELERKKEDSMAQDVVNDNNDLSDEINSKMEDC